MPVTLAALTFLASLGLWLALSTHSPILGDRGYFDLNVYRGGADLVLTGRPLYGVQIGASSFTYPPFAALVFIPLELMPLWLAGLVMAGVSIAALLVLTWATLGIRPAAAWLSPRRRWAVALLGAAVALWLEPVLTTLRYGQIDLVVAALVIGDMARPDGARGKGMMVGLAAGLKLTPLIFIAYLLLTRRTRAAIRALLTFGGTVAAGFLILWGDAAPYWDGSVTNLSRVGRLQNSANQSLLGAAARFLHSTDVRAVWLVLVIVIGAIGIGLAARAGRAGDDVTGVSLCAITGLLVSPISWTHHWVIAIPALFLLSVRAVHQRSRIELTAAAALWLIGWSHITWTIPRWQELHLDGAHFVSADAYVLCALVAIGVVGSARARLPLLSSVLSGGHRLSEHHDGPAAGRGRARSQRPLRS